MLDAKTGEPIVFASIYLKNRKMGVISNLDGGFKIPMTYRDTGDILIISSMGYQKQELLVNDLSIYKMNMIRLQPAVFELAEAILKATKKRKLSARQIVRRAIKAIPDNYSTEEFATIGYYRDYQLDSTKNYINLNESILEVFEQGFDALDTLSSKVRLYDYKENTDFSRDTMALQPYQYGFEQGRKVIDKAFLPAHGGNEFIILRIHDAIRNYNMKTYSFVYELKSDLLSEHKFSKEPDTYFDDEPLYTIRFSKLLPDYSGRGRMYIYKHNFAIHKMEYALYDRTEQKDEKNISNDVTNKKLIFEVTSEYRERYNKMYLNYISFHNTFQLWDPPIFKLEYSVVNAPEGYFKLVFNKKPDMGLAFNLNNYDVRYKGKKVNLKEMVVDGNDKSQRTLLLFPNMYPNKAEAMLRTIEVVARKKAVDSTLFNVKIQNLRDVEGNLINTWTSKNYNQFREFFVQEVKPKAIIPKDTLFMDKRRPIFKDQPIVKPENFGDYWMNTPLKTMSD